MSRNHGDRNDSDNRIRLLKKQAEALKREVVQLRKENKRLREAAGDDIDLESEDVDFTEIDKKARKRGEGLTCEACNKGTYMAFTISVRGVDKTYLTCGVCGDRKPQK
jgi:hypothetical protein